MDSDLSIILLLFLILIIFSGGTCYYHRRNVSYFINNYYTMWQNELKEMNDANEIGKPPGVLEFIDNEEICNESNEAIQSNVAFVSEKLGNRCSAVRRTWPGEMTRS